MKTKECCSERARKNIDQLQGEFKGSALIWDVYSQVSTVAFLWLHWWCRLFNYCTGCTCLVNCASPLTISWQMTIECWHFFESEWQFSEHSKKTQKWVSVCTAASLHLKRACLASTKLPMQGTNNSHHCWPMSPQPLLHSLMWFFFHLPTCRKMCGSVLCSGPMWLWKDGEQTHSSSLKPEAWDAGNQKVLDSLFIDAN